MANLLKRATCVALCAWGMGFASLVSAGYDVALDDGLGMMEMPTGEAEVQLKQRIHDHSLGLAQQRAQYLPMFEAAYARYPSIPKGTLEALAYVQTGWMHVQPDEHDLDYQTLHMPVSYGIMGLYDGHGFARQVDQAARLLGVSAMQVKTDPATNILAAAALLDAALAKKNERVSLASLMASEGSADDAWKAVSKALEAYAGFSDQPQSKSTQVGDFTRTMFAFNVLETIDRGVNDHGIVVPERPVAFERVFSVPDMKALQAPMVRLDVSKDSIQALGEAFDPVSETFKRTDDETAESMAKLGTDSANANDTEASAKSTDYGPAVWKPSVNHSSRRGSAVREVVIHTCQGGYAGCVSWLRQSRAGASAHYVINQSGHVTQLVRESRKAWHARSHNPYSIGIEHSGFVTKPTNYTSAMYSASAKLVRHLCKRYSRVNCKSAFKGRATAHAGPKIGDHIDIKGHQHLTDNNHNDPGKYWDWAKYYRLLNPITERPRYFIMDDFETSLGHFTHSPTYSGSTKGISNRSTSERICQPVFQAGFESTSNSWSYESKDGHCAVRVSLYGDGSSNDWAVRYLSGGGNPDRNRTLYRKKGTIGFWVHSGGSGMSVSVSIDDNDGTELSITKSIPANQWSYVEWKLDQSADWNAWVGGNGSISSDKVTLDAIWFHRKQTTYPVHLLVDRVLHKYVQ